MINLNPILSLLCRQRPTALFLCITIIFSSCSKSTKSSGGGTTPTGACRLVQGPGYTPGTIQALEYDDQGHVISRAGTNNSSGKQISFKETFTAKQATLIYDLGGGATDKNIIVNKGGSGNFWDGDYTSEAVSSYQENPGQAEIHFGDDTTYFMYDAKKRLSEVDIPVPFHSDNVGDYYVRHQIGARYDFTYDNNNNVVAIRFLEMFQEGIYLPQNPSQSSLSVDSSVYETVTLTYDGHPSPYIDITKYWAHIQDNWFSYDNADLKMMAADLSSQNPVSIHWTTQHGQPADKTDSYTYTYNDKGYPTDLWTYDCK